MRNDEIITELLSRYSKLKREGIASFDADIARQACKIFIEIDGKEYSITRQALADKLGDELADAIWLWVRR